MVRQLRNSFSTIKGVVPITGYLQGRPKARHEPLPLCFMASCNLKDEFKKTAGKDSPDYTSVHFVIHEDRECKAFTKWQQGFAPKEHREMIDRQWERKWRIIMGIIFIVLAGLFTLLGAYIANLN